MASLIIVFGVLTLLSGIVIVINPGFVFGFLGKNLDRSALHFLAVGIRLALGALLILEAGVSRLPLVVEILGWLSIAAATVLAVMGRGHFNRLMSWALSLSGAWGRAAGGFAAAFGAFLIYMFI